MSIKVPNASEVTMLQLILTPNLTLRLFSNNWTPDNFDVAASYTEVAGGGYLAKPLTFANWGYVTGNPSYALYNAAQTWLFTGVTNAPGTVYGFYVTRNSDGKLMWAERLAPGLLPFAPVAGSTIAYTPTFTADSVY